VFRKLILCYYYRFLPSSEKINRTNVFFVIRLAPSKPRLNMFFEKKACKVLAAI
jgi:hypothetical protein